MISFAELTMQLENGRFDDIIRKISISRCDAQGVLRERERIVGTVKKFKELYSPAPDAPSAVFSSPGRTEIGGNHTDHQRGHVLCAAVDMDIIACAVPNGMDVIRMTSDGYPEVNLKLNTLVPLAEERGSSAALIRGIAARFNEKGYSPCGLDICMSSDIPSGSGLSSSAAFEVIIGRIFEHFFAAKPISDIEIAQFGQYSENVFFGKPCGLMDQLACACGGLLSVDFAHDAPDIRRITPTDGGFSDRYVLCIIDTRSGHDDLTEDYAAIPDEMHRVAEYFGKNVLREVSYDRFIYEINHIRSRCGDRAVLRALHFFDEDKTAQLEADALAVGDMERFLSLVDRSGISSISRLQNIWVASRPHKQPVSLALEYGRTLLGGQGAIRVHGGGFAGTIQAFVPTDITDKFVAGMERLLGEDCCHVLHIRPVGGCLMIG